jgi:hypothetical protein
MRRSAVFLAFLPRWLPHCAGKWIGGFPSRELPIGIFGAEHRLVVGIARGNDLRFKCSPFGTDDGGGGRGRNVQTAMVEAAVAAPVPISVSAERRDSSPVLVVSFVSAVDEPPSALRWSGPLGCLLPRAARWLSGSGCGRW